MATDPPTVADDVPLRLADAVKIAFPMGGMTVSGLRRERDAGRLVVRRIAGKEFTTLADIRSMMEECRVQPKAPARAPERKPSGPSGMGKSSPALAALLATIQEQKESSLATSRKSTRRPPRKANKPSQ